MSRSAVVFAYHNVGVRCLKVLLAQGVDVRLVVTHQDNPNENIWFGSVRQVCEDLGIPYITPDDPNVPEVERQVREQNADFLFSFYYRHMLKAPLLESVKNGAYNMHGSLLPQFRGRVPVNWAIIKGATETGATLHQMNVKPDNGPIAGQKAVPILPDDTAQEVFEKVTVAAELCLYETLPYLLEGTIKLVSQDLTQGGYFGGRKAEDGRIDWSASAQEIHNLVRAVTRPYPGAFADTPLGRLTLWRTRVLATSGFAGCACEMELDSQNRLVIHTADGGLLQVLEGDVDGRKLNIGGIAHYLHGKIKLK